MHQSSLEHMQDCFLRHIKTRPWEGRDTLTVLDVGGANVNGSYADVFSGPEFRYLAADIAQGEGVDVVLDSPYELPFADGTVDVVVSGQAFEHVEFFWLLFAEMVRVLRDDGVIVLIAPSAGPIHRYPVDCYRFYPDAYRALAKYAGCQALEITRDERGPWKDLVGVFAKSDSPAETTATREWSTNRFEAPLAASMARSRNPDPAIETLRGEVPYRDVLKRLHAIVQPRLYLEIGVRAGLSFELATGAAIGIDPDPAVEFPLPATHQLISSTSDEFFSGLAKSGIGDDRIDFAFIDGMHLFEYALRDFINIERHASRDCVVVVDDIFPNHPVQASRLRASAAWTGDIWKLGYCLAEVRPDLRLTHLDTYPTGLLIITGLDPKSRVLTEQYNPLCRRYLGMPFAEVEPDVLERRGAISPNSIEFWNDMTRWLAGHRAPIGLRGNSCRVENSP